MAADDDKHDKALDLTEQALEALDHGDEKQADKLINAAKKLDPSALEEVVQDLAQAEKADGHDLQALDEDELEDDGEFEEADEDEEEEAR